MSYRRLFSILQPKSRVAACRAPAWLMVAFMLMATPPGAIRAAEAPVREGAPAMTVPLVDEDGTSFTMAALADGPVLVNFWATWCAPCKREMPSLEKLTNQFPQVKVYAINMEQPNKLKVRDFFRSIGVASLDTYYDPKLKLVKQFKMRGLPTSILIDKNGDEFGRVIGEIDFVSDDFISLIKEYI